MDVLFNKIEKIILFFIIYTVIFYLFVYTLKYSLPFVLAIIFSQALLKPTRILIKKFKLKSHIASLITTLIFVILVAFILFLLISKLVSQSLMLYRASVQFFADNTENINNIWLKTIEYYRTFDEQILSHLPDMSSLIKTFTDNFARVPGILKDFIFNIPSFLMVVLFTLLATYFLTDISVSAKSKFYTAFPDVQNSNLLHVLKETRKMFFNYVRSFLTVIGITFLECLTLLSIFRVNNAFIIAVLTAIADFLPVIGVGSVLISTGLIFLITGNTTTSIFVFVTYGIVIISRQIFEPKIISSSIGVNPVAILAAIFIGLKLDGIVGMFYLIFFVVGFTILRKVEVI